MSDPIFQESDSIDPNDLLIDINQFRITYPFTIVVDRNLEIRQVGEGLIRYLGLGLVSKVKMKFVDYLSIESPKMNFFDYFSIESPILDHFSFDSLLLNQNVNYQLKLISDLSKLKYMKLKGSIVFIEESDNLMFIGSPIIKSLEDLTNRGLYISDIPIHDATRDIILVEEERKAQEGLKHRMELIKQSIEKAHKEIEEEKQKNIDLLNLIFPSDIAKKLWMGERVSARSLSNVTLLYSDIVGFSSICSKAQPIEIIEMLKKLYTDFDYYCGLLDIYKIETIGDAYLTAGGLHKPSIYHAERSAFMSLLMIETAGRNYTNMGEKIKIRVGLHTGDVLAGIVGIKQPRYCLFGNNCAVGNKFESTSEEKRIHLSPITKLSLEKTPGFEMEARSPEFLPDNYVPKSENESHHSWFLNSYHHMDVDTKEECIVHVQTAIKEIDRLDQYQSQ